MLKGKIEADSISVNKYELLILGMPTFTFTEVSGIEEELETVDLPDRTTASGGNTLPVEFTVKLPMHHTVQQAAMELWFSMCKDPVSSMYKKEGTLIHYSRSGATLRTYSIIGTYPKKRKLPDLAMSNEGDMAENEWTMKADELLPI